LLIFFIPSLIVFPIPSNIFLAGSLGFYALLLE
jgi:hypothetical protein